MAKRWWGALVRVKDINSKQSGARRGFSCYYSAVTGALWSHWSRGFVSQALCVCYTRAFKKITAKRKGVVVQHLHNNHSHFLGARTSLLSPAMAVKTYLQPA